MSVLTEVMQLIHEKFGIDLELLKPEASLTQFGLDSLTLVELLFTIEEHFGIEIPDTRSDVVTLAGLAKLVEEQVAAKQP